MAFVVETGTGSSTANSYLSVSDADAYFLDHINSAWTGTDTAKEDALVEATQYLDSVYGPRWKGARALSTQALDFPRSGMTTRDGFVLDYDDIPTKLEHACAELAVRSLVQLAASSSLMPDLDEPGMIEEEENKVGPLMTRTKYQGGKSQVRQYRAVDALLADLILVRGAVARG